MKKVLLVLFTLLLNLSVFAGETSPSDSINTVIKEKDSTVTETLHTEKEIDSIIVVKQTIKTEETVVEKPKSIDDRINETIAPFTDWLVGVVFYSIPLHQSENNPVVLTNEKHYSCNEKTVKYNVFFKDSDTTTLSLLNGNVCESEKLELVVDNHNPYSTYTWIFKDTSNKQVKLKGHKVNVNVALLAENIKIQLVENGSGLPLILVWLIVASVFFTLSLKFINIRGIKYFPKIVKGAYTKPEDKGEVTHFQALTAALSGTVGLGNIAGVAVAIASGGPGATFWMIAAGLLGMSAKFVECTLGVKYRQINENGSISGGPMYYLTKGLAEKKLGTFGKVLAVIFAISCIGGSFGGGNMFQVNQAYEQFVNLPWFKGGFFSENAWVFGLIMAGIVGVVIIGGIKSIAKVTDKIVPFMCGIYVLAALIIIFTNAGALPKAIGLIFSSAFAPKAIAGGMIGVMIQGFKRAAFSNEAGIGSASIAHSAVKTGEPVTEGFVALLEPFIDTVVVCSMTALVLVITGYYDNGELSGISLTSAAFSSHFSWFKPILALAVILFAFSTMISWSYYGLKAWTYLFGENKMMENIYKMVFCLFIVVGASMSLGKVVDFSDSMIFLMSIPNIIGLYILSGDVRKDLASFIKRVKSGELKENK
ncbi:MAG: alanine:cation symporter family protein [Cytophagales bacterium]|nr:alanine:cation symporter family protein [Cytophagales bacterium]